MVMAVSTLTIPVTAAYGGTTQFGFYMSDTPPAVPFSGQPWYNTATGALCVYVYDGADYVWAKVN